jgi:hypothetical protein
MAYMPTWIILSRKTFYNFKTLKETKSFVENISVRKSFLWNHYFEKNLLNATQKF